MRTYLEPATEIVELSENIQVLFNRKREFINEFNVSKNKIEETRNSIWAQKRRLNELYTTRESLDRRFSELLELKRRLVVENTELRSQLNKKVSSLRSAGKRVSFEEITVLEKKVDDIEWKLQTEPKAKGLELKYGEEANKLRRELAQKKKVLGANEGVQSVKKNVEEKSEQIDNINEELDGIRAKLDDFKQETKQLKEALNLSVKEENNLFSKITSLRTSIEGVQAEINKLLSQKKFVVNKFKEKEMSYYQRELEKRKFVIKDELKKKLEKGESLSFQELQLLYDEGDY
jgi:uncharacterized coiled-coil DUF342 family protein